MAQQMAAMQVEIDIKDQAALHQAEAAQEELHRVSAGLFKILYGGGPVAMRPVMRATRALIFLVGWMPAAMGQGKLAVCVIVWKRPHGPVF